MVDAQFLNQLIPALNKGLWMSALLIIPSAIFGTIFGVIVGTLRVFGSNAVRRIFDGYTALFRGVPLMVQLFVFYFGLPTFGIYFEAYGASVTCFILCSAAYHSEYVRGALLSIREGQLKAGAALGMSRVQTVMWIVVPQAFRRALPGCGNEIVYLIKYSSLAYLISCMEVTGEARAIAAKTFRFTEVFMVLALYYLFLVSIASWLLKKFEDRLYIPGFGRQK
ncbi:amino acid ABC transporter permease [Desulfovibrio mangrovi]|uniref:amino acid ABC transporter permease n=1 Tax=Desulfovibrio mangrovi TaxID=2976983 RepID=UPI00224569AE|nr:amino acid ABC transporter permease [Desulfovibrio mangrovi]UZP69154.1 amino acid ABC transporter permease [Desulfovibrio mangrovi]